MTELSLYALDGVCHNAEPGTYGHECGKPAKWLGTDRTGFTAGFCDDCKANGFEAKGKTGWRQVNRPWRQEGWWSPTHDFMGYRVVRGAGADMKVTEGGEFETTSLAPIGATRRDESWRHRIAAQTFAVDLNRKERK